MSPKGTEVENFMICSQPTTPRVPDEDGLEDDWGIVRCHCQNIMQPEDTWCCCRCDHKFHHECWHICNDEIVCAHCKQAHFLPNQPFKPPLSNAALLLNISHGVAVAGSSKLKRLEHERLTVLDQLGRANPVDGESGSGAAFARANNSGNTNRSSCYGNVPS
eukprot:2892703-Amphidinium_carterae.1